MLKVLTIAGSDNSGGAGVQADLKVFSNLNVYGMSVITALTAQNTTGVKDIYPVSSDFVLNQIKTIAEDIKIDSAKTGMLMNEEIVEVVCYSIKKFDIKNLVIDTVFKSKNNKTLLTKEGIDLMIKKLLPLGTVITPNIPEAQIIAEMEIKDIRDMEKAARKIQKINKHIVLIKGGHLPQKESIVDIIFNGKDIIKLEFPYVKTKNTHGTGCTYSAAIASYLAKGYEPIKAIKLAKSYLHGAIENALNIGKGKGPLNHNWLVT